MLEKSLHLLELDGARLVSVQEIEEIAPVGLVHKDVAVLKTLPELARLDSAAAVDINHLEELLEGDPAGEDDPLDLAHELLLPHRPVLVPILEDGLELCQGERLPALGEPCYPVHRHHILRQHRQVL